jgi:1,2-dihydroxy-3-keto-5-methylthiopentene dioxygenase
MTILYIPDQGKELNDLSEIQTFLKERGIEFSKWTANVELKIDDDQETILNAYSHELKPFMEKYGFQTADVINVHPGIEGIEAIRQKFLKEHTHSEDEVRFFVDGEGKFWFHLNKEVFNILCQKGDFISVPAGAKHWFDLAPKYSVKAIRIFSNQEGWVANYTGSEIDEKYNS